MDRNRIRAVLSTLVFVFFVNFYIDHRIGSSGVALFLSGMQLFILSVADRGARSRKIVWGMSVSLLISIGAIVTNGSGFVQFIATFTSLLLLAVICYLSQSVSVSFDRLSRILSAPWELFIGYMRGVFSGWGYIVASFSKAKGIAGLVIGIPVAFMLLGLFSSADPIFGTMTKQIFSTSVMHTIITHLYISCIVFAVFLPLGFIVLSKQQKTIADWIIRVPFASEMSVVSLLVSLVTGAFLWVQWPYIFAKVARETDLAKFGVATYSEYVKRGFGEFIVISCLLYILLWLGLLALRSHSGKKLYGTVIQSIMLSEVFLFVVSIFRRVWLYQQFHGLTLGRVYGAFFLIWITILLITLLLRHFRRIRTRWVSVEIIGTLCLFAVFAYGPIETLVASYDPPTVNNRIDSVYLSHLSSSGYIGWLKAFQYTRTVFLETSYEKDTIINAQSRQSIEYAGMILATIKRRYDRANVAADYVFMWNLSDARANARMKHDMPLSEVTSMQMIYESLKQRIAKQPESERSVSFDVSFDGPFLSN